MPPVAVVGLGLIGGSLALSLVAHGTAVSAYDVDGATRRRAAANGLQAVDSLDALLSGLTSDAVVVLAVPLPGLPDVLSTVARHDGPTITDTTSVKGAVLAAARAAGVADRYVGAHPMAGTAASGFAAASVGLLDGARWVVTLEPDTDTARWCAVADLVCRARGRAVPMTSADHDRAVAWVSHLPHVVAEALAARADPRYQVLAAGSFRDATRVAGTRPELVEAMLTGNADAAADAADALAEILRQTATDLRAGLGLTELIADGHAARRSLDTPPLTVEVSLDRTSPTLAADLLALGSAGGWVEAVGPTLRARRPRGT